MNIGQKILVIIGSMGLLGIMIGLAGVDVFNQSISDMIFKIGLILAMTSIGIVIIATMINTLIDKY